jgi:hypothetical protein
LNTSLKYLEKRLQLLLGAAVHRATVSAEQTLCASPGRFVMEQLANRLVDCNEIGLCARGVSHWCEALPWTPGGQVYSAVVCVASQ